MASLTRVNGSILSGVDVNTAVGSIVAFGGTQPACFKILVKNTGATAIDLRTEETAGEVIDEIFKALTLQATLVLFQVENTTAGQISVMMEQRGSGWTAASLQTAIRALGSTVGANSVDVTGTLVTDVGFKLA
jgi:hypothetical protein